MTVRLVDCSFELADPGAGRRAYLAGHAPGAAFLDLETDLSGSSGSGGRHPLPTADEFAVSASRAGIGPDTLVVAYGNGAARLWWLLRHFGHAAAGIVSDWHGPLENGDEQIEPATFVPRERHDDTIDAATLHARLSEPGLAVLDARTPERFRGEREPIDPVAGRIPGALNWPVGTPPPDLTGATEIVAYCGSGVSACELLVRLPPGAKLYPGSWSDWITHDLPIERG